MPYIKQTARQELQTRAPLNPGELNYTFTCLIKKGIFEEHIYLAIAYEYWKQQSFQDYMGINAIMGAFYCAHVEYHRRTKGYSGVLSHGNILLNVAMRFYMTVAIPYEDAKIQENGDIY